MIVSAALAVALMFAADPSPASSTPQPDAAKPAAESEKDRIICKREHEVGSNRRKKICRTVQEWNHIRDQSQGAMRDADRASPNSQSSGPL